MPIWDSSDVLITIIGKRHHRPEPAHGIIFGHASRRWLRFRAESNKGLAGVPSFGKEVGACRWDRSIPSRTVALIWPSR